MGRPDSELETDVEVREVLQPLVKHKWWILGMAVGVGVLAFLANQFLVQERYNVHATILLAAPRLNANLDGRIEIVQQSVDPRVIPDAAMSTDLLRGVYDAVASNDDAGDLPSFNEFRGGVRASVAGNSVLLQVTDSDPDRAAYSANLWAAAVAERLNELYGLSETAVARLDQQAAQAEKHYDEAQRELEGYLARSSAETLEQQYDDAQREYASQLAEIGRIETLIEGFERLQAGLAGKEPNSLLTGGQALDLIALQYRTVGELFSTPAVVAGPADTGPAAQVSPPTALGAAPSSDAGGILVSVSPPSASVREANDSIQDFVSALVDRLEAVQTDLLATEADLAARRGALEAATQQQEQIVSSRDRAWDTYDALLDQAASLRIELASAVKPASVLGSVVPPEGSSSPGPVVITALAGMIGLTLGAMGAVGLEWWKRNTNRG